MWSGHWRGFRGPGIIIAVKWCILCGCCVKHNQHAKHANAKRVWGYAPMQENFENGCSEIESEESIRLF